MIVDDYLNKREIKAKSPSIYMKIFANENPNLQETLKTHLIENLDEFGIWLDDYDLFLSKRASVISQELQKRLIRRDIDKYGQISRADDFEEETASYE